MFPLVHPGVAYLCYAIVLHFAGRDVPDDRATIALVLGSILPDLIDLPLHAAFSLPSTRTVGHSLLVAVPVCVIVGLLVRQTSLPMTVAAGFAVGYTSHLLADAFWPLVLGIPDELGFLLWPLTPSPPYVGQKPLIFIGDVAITTLWIELPLLLVAVVLWWTHGRPGLPLLRAD